MKRPAWSVTTFARGVATAVFFACLAVSSGCGGDDDSARPQCEKLVRTYCRHLSECAQGDDLFVDGYRPGEFEADCFDTITETALECERADDVSDDYGACVSAVKRIDCADANAALLVDEYISPPAICDDTILFAE